MVRHFNRAEFRCHCRCMGDTVDYELMDALEALRLTLGKPINISSGFRCAEHNKKVNGAKNSYHLLGKAADIIVADVSPEDVARAANGLWPHKYGIGVYKGHTHIDVRSHARARWGIEYSWGFNV